MALTDKKTDGESTCLTVTVVTPSFNHGKYIEETIASVLSQEGNFFLEYIIMDGGSKDNTVEIIKKYERLLEENKYPVKCKGITFHWSSGPDRGQGDAVSKGFAMAQGEILGWLNSDDVYCEGALMTAVECFQNNPNIGYSYGDIYTMHEDGSGREYAEYPAPYHWKNLVQGKRRGLVQPSVFVKREVFQKAGPIRHYLYFVLDQDWFIRVDQISEGKYIHFPFAAERLHSQAKTHDRFNLEYIAETILLLTKFGGKKTCLINFGCVTAELAIKKGISPEDSFNAVKEALLKRGDITDLSLLTPEFLARILGYGFLRFSQEICRQDIRRSFTYLFRAIKLCPESLIRAETYMILIKVLLSKGFYKKMLLGIAANFQFFLLSGLSWFLTLLFSPWRFFRKISFRLSSKKIREVLIVYMAEGLGDAIMLSGALPAIRRKFHDTKITLMIFSRYEEYFRDNPHVDELLGYPDFLFRKNGLISFLQFAHVVKTKCQPDILFDLLPNKNFQPAFFSCFFSSRFSVGFGYLWKNACFDQSVPVDWGKHIYEVLFDGLKWAGIEAQAPQYWIPPLEMETDLSNKITWSEKCIVIAPGGKNNLVEGSNNSGWDFNRYEELARDLIDKNYRLILVGAEYDRNDVWDQFDRSHVINLIGATSIRQLFNLVKKKADVVVCNNSGLLHVAAALGVPTVSFAGPLENIVRFGPYPNDGRHKVLQPKMGQRITKEEFLNSIIERLSLYDAQKK